MKSVAFACVFAGVLSAALPASAGSLRNGGARIDQVAKVLRSAGLPHEDFAAHLAHFVVARDQHGAVIGAVGAEICGADALLRSLVVAPGRRGAGLGEALISALEAHAGAWGVQRWWLLTTTAERFFVARGFVASERAAAPAAIRATGQFNGGCSCAAVCLTRERRNAAP